MPDTRALNQCYKRWREISTMIPIWERAYIDHSLPFALLAPLLGLLRVLGHCGHFSLVAFFSAPGSLHVNHTLEQESYIASSYSRVNTSNYT